MDKPELMMRIGMRLDGLAGEIYLSMYVSASFAKHWRVHRAPAPLLDFYFM